MKQIAQRLTQGQNMLAMRTLFLAVLALSVPASATMAQDEPHDEAKRNTKSVPLPQLTIRNAPGQGSNAASGPGTQGGAAGGCGNVQPGSNDAINCLNRQMQNQVNGVNPSVPSAPLNASSTDIKVGTANTSAVKQQYGKNYGVSVIPFRSPAPPLRTR